MKIVLEEIFSKKILKEMTTAHDADVVLIEGGGGGERAKPPSFVLVYRI